MHIEFRLTLKVVFRWDPLAVFLVRRFILTRRGLDLPTSSTQNGQRGGEEQRKHGSKKQNEGRRRAKRGGGNQKARRRG